MGRRRLDDEKRYVRAFAALLSVKDDPEYERRVGDFVTSMIRGYRSGTPYREVNNGCYSGPYYELRELCDDFLLPWPDAAELILNYMSGNPLRMRLPSDQARRHFRMARKGLGRPTAEEIGRLRRINGHVKPHRRRRFDPADGFTYEEIAALDGCQVRTVQNNVSNVRRFLTIKNYARLGYETPEGKELIERWMRSKPEE